MSAVILSWSLLVSQCILGAAMILAALGMIRGPRAQDRVLAFDALYMAGMLLLIAFGIRTGSRLYLEASLVVAVLGFVSTSALAKFLMRGEVIE